MQAWRPRHRQKRRRTTARIRAIRLGRTSVGGVDQELSSDEVTAFVTQALARADLDDKRVCLVVPDGTRTCPLPLLMRAAHSALKGRAKEVTVVIALGTHQGMSEDHLARHLGYSAGAAEETYPGWTILNHESWLPETFTTLGTIGAERLTRADWWPDARRLRGRADQPACR